MATRSNFFKHFSIQLPCSRKPKTPALATHFTSLQETPSFIYSNALKLSANRLGLNKKVAAVVSQEKEVATSDSGTDVFKLTYLEGNSWLWEVGGVKILVDPVLEGNLDFGIPWFYDAAKKSLNLFKLDDLPGIDCLLITQSLDDHCHLKTLKPLSQKLPNLRVIATPNAKGKLDPLFTNVTYLEPGQASEIQVNDGSSVKIRATAGPVLGPPWQRPENGYLVTSPEGELTLYYEPHCVYKEKFLEKYRADIVITPVIKQLLPKFTLVSGQEDAVRLAKLLHAQFIVTMKNGDLDSKGLLASLVKTEGTTEAFEINLFVQNVITEFFPSYIYKNLVLMAHEHRLVRERLDEILSKELPDAKVIQPTPGKPVEISARA